MGRARLALIAFAVVVLAPLRAHASFHEWEVKEVFSNADGSIQYIRLVGNFSGQGFLTGHTLTVSNNGATPKTFTFPTDLPGTVNTSGASLLLATPGFAHLQGAPAPDYTLPCGPFFDPTWTTIKIDFAAGNDVESFLSSALPTDGVNSLTDTVASPASGNATWTSTMNAPRNTAGSVGPITLTTAQKNGTADACDDGNYCNGAETCVVAACAGVSPCEDSNPCTDDTCDEGTDTCGHTAHAGSCNDGIFCNGVDVCSGTTCTHPGTPCGAQNCNEGPDTCGDCATPADCDEGNPCTIDTCTSGTCSRATAADGAECDTDTTYCNGVGTCTAGVCGGNAEPCDTATAICNESSRTCSPNDMTPDAGDMINPVNDDDGGCCQANTTPATFSGPLLVLGLGLLVGRRRRRR